MDGPEHQSGGHASQYYYERASMNGRTQKALSSSKSTRPRPIRDWCGLDLERQTKPRKC